MRAPRKRSGAKTEGFLKGKRCSLQKEREDLVGGKVLEMGEGHGDQGDAWKQLPGT